MSANNWVGDNSDMSPDRSNRYQLDNVGLQLGLGLPIQLLGVSLAGAINRRSRSNVLGQRYVRTFTNKGESSQNNSKSEEIQQTVDGIPIRKVYITNIHIEVQRAELYDIFNRFGMILNVYLRVSKNDNLKQFAFITFADPKAAARVLYQHKFVDRRGRSIFASAADSWHQPQEGPDGKIVWTSKRRPQVPQDEGNDDEADDDQAVVDQVQTVEIVREGLNVLNDDCLLHIFSFLSYKEITGVERVCKRWQALSYRMWRCLHELNFTEPPFNKMDATTPTLDQYLRRCGESLTLLDLAVNNHAFNETTLAVIAKYCSKLEVLRVANIQVGHRTLAHLGRSCPRLKQLVMDGCAKFTDNDLMSLLPKCQDLQHLDLSHTDGIIGKCLMNVKGPISNLKLCNCPSIDTNYLIAGLQRMANTLDSLTLSACGNLRSSEVGKIVSAVPNLTSLSLCRCFHQLDGKALASVGQLTKLTTLNLNLNSAVNDSVLVAIIEGCDNLTTVNLSGSGGGCAGVLSDRGLSMVARLRKLTDLDISYLEAANDTTLKNISARSTKLKRLVCRGCPDLTDEGCTQVVTMCNELELLDLSGCNNVGDKSLEAAITSVKMRTNNVHLKVIAGGTNITSLEKVKDVPTLTVDLTDLSEEHLRPDFIDDMFFPPSDSEDEEDLDHLCERIGCDCDFDYDDLYDPTLCDYKDDTTKFSVYDDSIYEEMNNWTADEWNVDDDDNENWQD